MFNVPLTRRRFFFADPYFESCWEDYDQVRSLLAKEDNSTWKKFEDKMKEQPCMSSDLVASDLDYYGVGGGK